MQDLTPKQKKAIEKIQRVAQKGNAGILEHLLEIEDQIPDITEVISRVKGEKGDDGKPGKDGSEGRQGQKGDKGDPGKDGRNGKDGKEGRNGRDGLDGSDGRNGLDGTSANVEEIETSLVLNLPKFGDKFRDGLSLLPKGEMLPIDAVENLPEELRRIEERAIVAGHGGGGPTRKILAGTNISVREVGGDTIISSTATGGSGTPGGSDTQVQFNDGGAFGGDSAFAWNKTTDSLTVNGQADSGTGTRYGLHVTGGVGGSAYVGFDDTQSETFSGNAANFYSDTAPTSGYDFYGQGTSIFGSSVQTNLRVTSATISTIAGFNSNKDVISLDTATYPSLTELSYVKGVTSSIQTQINALGTNYWQSQSANQINSTNSGNVGIGLNTSSVSAKLQVLSTSSSGQGRFLYSATQYYNIAAQSTGNTILNAVGTTPKHTFQLGGTEIAHYDTSGLFVTGAYINVNNVDGGAYIGSGTLNTFESGLYNNDADQQIASYNTDIGTYYYFGGTMFGNTSTASYTGNLTISDGIEVYRSSGDILRMGSNGAVYLDVTQNSTTGVMTWDLNGGSGPAHVFSEDVSVPDEAYDATNWNGSLEVPTKNAVRDKIEAMSAASGITRSVNVVTGTTSAGSSAATDYVYLCSGTFTVTVPTAVSNTNRYTVKNEGTGTVTIAFTSGQNADGSTSFTLVPNVSIDLISNNSNWRII